MPAPGSEQGAEYWTPAPIWADRTVFVIGGGRSLEGFDFERLQGCHALAVNAAFVDAPWADAVFFRDHEWFSRNRELLAGWAGLIVTVSPAAKADWPDRIALVAANTEAMPRARTSGHQAVSLALMLGARRIVLLGFDWNPEGGNYHDRHARRGLQYRGGLLESWRGYRERAARAGAAIVNATRHSAIREFPKVELGEELAVESQWNRNVRDR